MPTAARTNATPEHQSVNAPTAYDWLKAGQAVIVDVREPDERAREHIAGSMHMPLSSFDPVAAAALPGTRIVFHCRSGSRSREAAKFAAVTARPGVAIYSLDAGLEGWKQAALPTEVNKQAARISIMRQVQLTVGVAVVTGSALTWFVHPAFIAIPAFFGAGLVFAGATGTCGLAAVLSRMPWNRIGACPTGH